MAVSEKAPIGQRVLTALIALFGVLAVVALVGSPVRATWYGVALALVALCGAYAFGRIAVSGRLPGHFRAGGNAFIGAGQNGEPNHVYRSAPIWQRVICGVLAIGGGVALVAEVLYGVSSHQSLVSLLFGLGGLYLFGYIAVRGRLPRPYFGGGNAALNHHNGRGGG